MMLGANLLVVLLGLSAAASWGAGDFSGGLASRRSSVFTVVVLSQFLSLLILAAGVMLVAPEPITAQAAVWGGLAGICGAIGLLALYAGLARGPMGVVAPLTAVVAAVVPVVFSEYQSGLPAGSDMVGILLALVAVWIISSGDSLGKINLNDLILPMIAGLGFGGFFILIATASQQSTLWPLVFTRCLSVIFILLVSIFLRKIELPNRGQVPLIASAGIFDTGGNILFILAARFGRLDVAAVLSSLYPAMTVFLAWLLLRERLTQRQWMGVILVFLAVVLIAI